MYLFHFQVRDELEHLLDDDEDMAEMYLTDKMVQQHLENSSQPSIDEHDGVDDDVARSDMDDRHVISLHIASSFLDPSSVYTHEI